MRRWLSALVICLAGTALAAPQNNELGRVRKDLASSKQAEAAIEAKLEENARNLEKLADRAADLAETLQRTESRVSDQEDNAGDIEAERRTKQQEFDQRRKEYADTLASLIALNRIPPAALFADQENIEPMLRTASLLENTNEMLAERAAKLKRDMRALKALKTRADKQQEMLRKEKTRLVLEQANLRKELASRQDIQKKLLVNHEMAEARVSELSRKSRTLQDLLQRLASQPQATKAKSARRTRDFAAAKGSMRAPVVGNIMHRFGEKKNENETWRGMVLRARPGGSVVAPYDGEVVFTGPFRDYGRMILIKHNNGFISLLAGLGIIDVSLNQTIRKGEPVGSMPNAGAPDLYVELRDRSKPIDPAGWFANVGRRLAKN